MITGIYCFENIINLDRYAGQAQDIETRRKAHLYLLNNNKYTDSIYFQNAWEKYGAENFRFWIVEECAIELLDEREIYWIKELHSHVTEHGYNLSWGGEATMRGLNHTPETKQKISKSNKGKNKGKPSPRLGKHLSEDSKKKIGKARKEKYSGKNHPMFGKHHTEETKKEISLKATNRVASDAARKNMSKAQTGRIMLEETKKKISKANSGRKFPNSTSGYFGVYKDIMHYKDKSYIYWRAYVSLNGRVENIGKYKTEVDAAINYDAYIKKYSLSKPLNFPENIQIQE